MVAKKPVKKAAAKAKAQPKRTHVVVCISRRGMNVWHEFYGPFTKAEAGAYASHCDMYRKQGEYFVYQMNPLAHHEKYIVNEIS